MEARRIELAICCVQGSGPTVERSPPQLCATRDLNPHRCVGSAARSRITPVAHVSGMQFSKNLRVARVTTFWGGHPVTIRDLRVHSTSCSSTTPCPPFGRTRESNSANPDYEAGARPREHLRRDTRGRIRTYTRLLVKQLLDRRAARVALPPGRIERPTIGLKVRCATNCATEAFAFSRDRRTRTGHLRRIGATLCHMS